MQLPGGARLWGATAGMVGGRALLTRTSVVGGSRVALDPGSTSLHTGDSVNRSAGALGGLPRPRRRGSRVGEAPLLPEHHIAENGDAASQRLQRRDDDVGISSGRSSNRSQSQTVLSRNPVHFQLDQIAAEHDAANAQQPASAISVCRRFHFRRSSSTTGASATATGRAIRPNQSHSVLPLNPVQTQGIV